MLKTKVRRKVLVVPYVFLPSNKIKLVMFKDTQTGEWTLMSGGCKQKESFLECGHRELSEESNNAVEFSKIYDTFAFTTSYRPPRFQLEDETKGLKILSKYTVYLFEISCAQFNMYCKNYYKTKNKETTDMKLCDIDKIAKDPSVWEFIRKTCIPRINDFFGITRQVIC